MFWKKKPAADKPTEVKTEVPKANKKKLSPRETMINQIEQLGAGQILRYRLRESWGAAVDDEMAVIELNPQYPEKGQKYILSTEKLVDGKPTGERTRLVDANKPGDLAGWVVDRKGEPFIEAEE